MPWRGKRNVWRARTKGWLPGEKRPTHRINCYLTPPGPVRGATPALVDADSSRAVSVAGKYRIVQRAAGDSRSCLPVSRSASSAMPADLRHNAAPVLLCLRASGKSSTGSTTLPIVRYSNLRVSASGEPLFRWCRTSSCLPIEPVRMPESSRTRRPQAEECEETSAGSSSTTFAATAFVPIIRCLISALRRGVIPSRILTPASIPASRFRRTRSPRPTALFDRKVSRQSVVRGSISRSCRLDALAVRDRELQVLAGLFCRSR